TESLAFPLCNGAVPLVFCAESNLLDRLSFLFGTFQRANPTRVLVELYEVGAHGDACVRRMERNGITIHDNSWADFSFEPIPESLGKWYRVMLSSPDATERSGVAVYGSIVPKRSSIYTNLEADRETGLISCVNKRGLSERDLVGVPVRSLPESRRTPRRLEHATMMSLRDDQDLVLGETIARRLIRAAEKIALRSGSIPYAKACAALREVDYLFLSGPELLNPGYAQIFQAARFNLVPVIATVDGDPAAFRSSLPRVAPGIDAIVTTSTECAAVAREAGLDVIEWSGDPGAIATPLEHFAHRYRRRHLPKISVLSVLYGKEREVEAFLTSLCAQRYAGEVEIILVDDKSPDRSRERAQSFGERLERGEIAHSIDPGISIIVETENRGNCAARNRALDSATGDVVVIVDADCVFPTTFLESHARAFSTGDCDVVTGYYNLETVDREPFAALAEYERDPERVRRDGGALQDPRNQESYLNCVTRNLAIRREFLGTQRFDGRFAYTSSPTSGYGWEDVELGVRLNKQRARVKFCGETFSLHISHESLSNETTKPARSLQNFQLLLDTHPELRRDAPEWVSRTLERIKTWGREAQCDFGAAYASLNSALDDARRYAPRKKPAKRLRVLTYRWHCPHQYELHALEHDFSLVRFGHPQFVNDWQWNERPLRDNARFVEEARIRARDYDLCLLHFDENSLAAYNSNNVLPHSWGEAFRWMMECIELPKVAICHGTPQFFGQYSPQYSCPDLGKVIEEERVRLVRYLGNTPVVLNSHQAAEEWGFRNQRVIWHGFDPVEFGQTDYSRGVLTLGKMMSARPYYRGYDLYQRITANLPKGIELDMLSVPEPDLSLPRGTNVYARVKFRNYRETLQRYSIYLNPTRRSPMPRSRGEAMMCGVVPVTTSNHDATRFIEHGKNGFVSDDPAEIARIIQQLLGDPTMLRDIGREARARACEVFHVERYRRDWQELLTEVI
ncbi:MAG: glycosyltransferase, partial [Deltaproteobacteria bacterium]|nr:glycosyltransferase [Deltaproteobacteria bacterium]